MEEAGPAVADALLRAGADALLPGRIAEGAVPVDVQQQDRHGRARGQRAKLLGVLLQFLLLAAPGADVPEDQHDFAELARGVRAGAGPVLHRAFRAVAGPEQRRPGRARALARPQELGKRYRPGAVRVHGVKELVQGRGFRRALRPTRQGPGRRVEEEHVPLAVQHHHAVGDAGHGFSSAHGLLDGPQTFPAQVTGQAADEPEQGETQDDILARARRGLWRKQVELVKEDARRNGRGQDTGPHTAEIRADDNRTEEEDKGSPICLRAGPEGDEQRQQGCADGHAIGAGPGTEDAHGPTSVLAPGKRAATGDRAVPRRQLSPRRFPRVNRNRAVGIHEAAAGERARTSLPGRASSLSRPVVPRRRRYRRRA